MRTYFVRGTVAFLTVLLLGSTTFGQRSVNGLQERPAATAGSIAAQGAVVPMRNRIPVGGASNPLPDFVGAVDPSYENIVTGGTASYTITVTGVNGFAGIVHFGASGLPLGATAMFTPSTVTGSGSTTLTIKTSQTTPKGTYLIELTGTCGTLVHAGGVALNVGPAGTNFTDFTGSIQPSFQTTGPGGSVSFDLDIIPLYGFTSDVRLSASDLPAGATAMFTPLAVAGGSGPSVMTISTASSTPTGTYRITVTGTGGGRTHENTIAVNVGPPGMDFTDFTGSIAPLSQKVEPGGSASYTVNIQPLYGTGCVTLQTLNVPPMTSASYNPSARICGAPASTVLTVLTTLQTPPGTYVITVQGLSSGGITHSENVTLTVAP